MKPASFARLEPPPLACYPASVLTACEPRGEMASGSGRPITRDEPCPESASEPSAPDADAPSGPVPSIRLKRKCQSAWTCSSPENASPALPKLRRGRAKIKFRPWMAQPLVVKEGDANLRLATDLPRFNWLELKLNQKQEVAAIDNTSDMVLAASHETSVVPLKIRILEKTSASHSPPVTGALPDAQSTQTKQEESAESRWPLKKRFIRPEPDERGDGESRLSPSTSPDAETKLNAQDDSPPTLARLPTDGEGSPAQRGPVIIKNVLPPTPPASIELPSTVSDTDQDRPLDLSSKRAASPEPRTTTTTGAFKPPPPARREDKAEVEIIAMTTRTPPVVAPTPVRPAVANFLPEQAARLARGTAEMQRVPDKGFLVRPVREHTIQAIPHPDRSRVNPPRPYQPVQPVPLPATHGSRPFALPPLRPLAQHWSLATQQQERHIQQQQQQQKHHHHHHHHNHHQQQQQQMKQQLQQQQFQQHQLQQLQKQFQHQIQQQQQQQHHLHQQQRSMIVRPEVQLHAVGPGPPLGAPGAPFVPTASFFHPKPPPPPPSTSVAKKPVVTVPAPAHPVTTLPSDWALRSCVVCSRRADFRCAGCHGNAYCSTLCQARDWPSHSQLCQRNS